MPENRLALSRISADAAGGGGVRRHLRRLEGDRARALVPGGIRQPPPPGRHREGAGGDRAPERQSAVSVPSRQAAEAHQEDQIERLDMARTSAQARAEVAESRPASQPRRRSPQHIAVAAAAGRLRAMAIAMRACGIGLETSGADRAAGGRRSGRPTALHDPTDHRAQKLSEVLQYLEYSAWTRCSTATRGRPGRGRRGPGAAAPEEKPAEGGGALRSMKRVPDEPTTLVTSSPISETPSGTAADTVVEIAQPLRSDETTSASPDVSDDRSNDRRC